MGHDTALEKEVHSRMTNAHGKTFAEQKRERNEKDKRRQSTGSPLNDIQNKASSWMVAALRASRDDLNMVSVDPIVSFETTVDEDELLEAAEGVINSESDDTEDLEAEEDSSVRSRQTFHAKIVNIEDKRILMNIPGAGVRYFDYDGVIGGTSDQTSTYKQCALPVLDAFLNGYSACIFVYGQTGSGKVYEPFLLSS